MRCMACPLQEQGRHLCILTCDDSDAALFGLVPEQDNGFREGDHVRRIPFEVMVKGDAVPFYEETLEDAGRFNEQPVLPFNACVPLFQKRLCQSWSCAVRGLAS